MMLDLEEFTFLCKQLHEVDIPRSKKKLQGLITYQPSEIMTVFNISVTHNRILGVIRKNLGFTIVGGFLD
jgi:hypothetical protein